MPCIAQLLTKLMILLLLYFQECFNTPYGAKYFQKHAEPLHGHTTNLLSEIAKECKIYLVGGMHMHDGGKSLKGSNFRGSS